MRILSRALRTHRRMSVLVVHGERFKIYEITVVITIQVYSDSVEVDRGSFFDGLVTNRVLSFEARYFG